MTKLRADKGKIAENGNSDLESESEHESESEKETLEESDEEDAEENEFASEEDVTKILDLLHDRFVAEPQFVDAKRAVFPAVPTDDVLAQCVREYLEKTSIKAVRTRPTLKQKLVPVARRRVGKSSGK